MKTLYESIIDVLDDEVTYNKIIDRINLHSFIEWMIENTLTTMTIKNNIVVFTKNTNIEETIEIVAPYIEIKNKNVIFNKDVERLSINCGKYNTQGTLKNCPYTISFKDKNKYINLYFDTYNFVGIKLSNIFLTGVNVTISEVLNCTGITKDTFKNIKCKRFIYESSKFGLANIDYRDTSHWHVKINDINILPQRCEILKLRGCDIITNVRYKGNPTKISLECCDSPNLNWISPDIKELIVDYDTIDTVIGIDKDDTYQQKINSLIKLYKFNRNSIILI